VKSQVFMLGWQDSFFTGLTHHINGMGDAFGDDAAKEADLEVCNALRAHIPALHSSLSVPDSN
jgi:hypothetical protein